MTNTVTPPLSDHPKCKDLVITYDYGDCVQLWEETNRTSFPRRGPDTFTLWKIIYCMQSLKCLFTWRWGTLDRWRIPLRWGKKITLLYMQSYNPAILGCTFSRLLNGRYKHVNKKNTGKPRVLVIYALLHSLAAPALTFSALAFYCSL